MVQPFLKRVLLTFKMSLLWLSTDAKVTSLNIMGAQYFLSYEHVICMALMEKALLPIVQPTFCLYVDQPLFI